MGLFNRFFKPPSKDKFAGMFIDALRRVGEKLKLSYDAKQGCVLVATVLLCMGLCKWCMAGEPATVLEKGRLVRQDCTVLSDLKSFRPAAFVTLSKYGGWRARREKATGFFHTAQVNGRWWLVDPEGCLFLCVGVNSVARADEKHAGRTVATSAAAMQARSVWAERTVAMLRQHGFNMLGCWSDTDTVRRLAQPMPYCLRWNFMASYRHQRLAKFPVPSALEAVYPFDPEFERFCDEHARDLAETKDDSWLVGHFSDNELPLHEEGIVTLYSATPAAILVTRRLQNSWLPVGTTGPPRTMIGRFCK